MDHSDVGRLEHELRTRGVTVRGVSYGARVTIHVAVPHADSAAFEATLAELSAGAATAVAGGTDWIDRSS
jgi:putative IMPACT (imprinted ancient) family translation regulator